MTADRFPGEMQSNAGFPFKTDDHRVRIPLQVLIGQRAGLRVFRSGQFKYGPTKDL